MDVPTRFRPIELVSPHSLAPDIPDEAFTYSKALPLPLDMRCNSPPSPWSGSSSSTDSSTEESGEEYDTQLSPKTKFNDLESLPPAFRKAGQDARLWSVALRAKKTAMENLLYIQKALEQIEESVLQHTSMESIQDTHAQFLSALDPDVPEASYLIAIGRLVVKPLPSHLPPIIPCHNPSPSNSTGRDSRSVKFS